MASSSKKKSAHRKRAEREPYIETPEMYSGRAKRDHYVEEPGMYMEHSYAENSYADASAVGKELVAFNDPAHVYQSSEAYTAGYPRESYPKSDFQLRVSTVDDGSGYRRPTVEYVRSPNICHDDENALVPYEASQTSQHASKGPMESQRPRPLHGHERRVAGRPSEQDEFYLRRCGETFDRMLAAGIAERPKLAILGCLALLNNSRDPGVPLDILTPRSEDRFGADPLSERHSDDIREHIDSMVELQLIVPPRVGQDGVAYVNLNGVVHKVTRLLLQRLVRNNLFQEMFEDCVWRLSAAITVFGVEHMHLVHSLFLAEDDCPYEWTDPSTALCCGRMLRDVIRAIIQLNSGDGETPRSLGMLANLVVIFKGVLRKFVESKSLDVYNSDDRREIEGFVEALREFKSEETRLRCRRWVGDIESQ